MRVLESIVPAESEGRKLKYYVRGDMGVSYHQYSALKREDGLTVNGNPARANDLLHEGDLIRACLPDAAPEKDVAAEHEPVNILYRDEDLMIIDKPAPLACQCSPKQPGGTLENRLRGIFGPDFVFRPLNRLDRGTSGLMAAAMNAHACQRMQSQLHTPDFVREYLAVVEGEFDGEGVVDLPISKEESATVRRVIDPANGKPAVTRYRTLGTGNGRTLVRLRLETGRTHQIRVHMASIGHPVTGDFLYGHEIPELPQRFALHSAYIQLVHPVLKRQISYESPLPPELAALMRRPD